MCSKVNVLQTTLFLICVILIFHLHEAVMLHICNVFVFFIFQLFSVEFCASKNKSFDFTNDFPACTRLGFSVELQVGFPR